MQVQSSSWPTSLPNAGPHSFAVPQLPAASWQLGAGADDAGDIITPAITPQAIFFSLVYAAAVGASVYHGYKRNNSIGWALAWGVAGSLAPVIAVPVALAQGFGKRKG